MLMAVLAVIISLQKYEVTASDSEDLISVELPVICETGNSPFDFIMDPQGLINQTGAIRYGGRTFEEGATLYFENTDGQYDYSHQSDWIEVISRSTMPVRITITARICNISSIKFTQDNSFYEDESASVYLALINNRGDLMPLDINGEAVIDTEMQASDGEENFRVCSFALTGACNPNGDWINIDEKPYIAITWTIDAVAGEDGKYQDELVTVSGNDILNQSMDENETSAIEEPDANAGSDEELQGSL